MHQLLHGIRLFSSALPLDTFRYFFHSSNSPTMRVLSSFALPQENLCPPSFSCTRLLVFLFFFLAGPGLMGCANTLAFLPHYFNPHLWLNFFSSLTFLSVSLSSILSFTRVLYCLSFSMDSISWWFSPINRFNSSTGPL